MKTKVFKSIGNLNLSERFMVNSGGCGVFALKMLEFFPDMKVLYVGYQGDYPPAHVVLTDGKYFYDAAGAHKEAPLSSKYGDVKEVSKETLKRHCQREWEWNDMFDRSNMDVISKEVAVAVTKVQGKMIFISK